MLTVINYIMIACYDYDFTIASKEEDSIPRWVLIVAGVNVFVAYTLDAIDGKHARRTGSSSPVGELFDHGLDSYSSIFIMIYLFSLFGIHDLPPLRMHFITYCVYLNFYVSTIKGRLGARFMGARFYIRTCCSSHISRSTTRAFSSFLTPTI